MVSDDAAVLIYINGRFINLREPPSTADEECLELTLFVTFFQCYQNNITME